MTGNPTLGYLKEKKTDCMKALKLFILFIIPCTIIALVFTAAEGTDNESIPDRNYRLMFYNVENLFHPSNDPDTDDDAFTPDGDMHWTMKRYDLKINNLYKVITAVGEWSAPDIIGLCEAEGYNVLNDLIQTTPLVKYPYKIIHRDSPDKRGIDVAVIYNSAKVRPIGQKFLSMQERGINTRDILYLKVLIDKDTCHILVNHWPSRSDGQIETDPARKAAAELLKRISDSVFSVNIHSKIIAMGDFNDEPSDVSLLNTLKADTSLMNILPGQLYNLSSAPKSGKIKGSLKYQGIWNLFDQFIVSSEMIVNRDGLHTGRNDYHIAGYSFLLTEDAAYTGYKPLRTYNGFRYQGGFSDHLPVYLDLWIE